MAEPADLFAADSGAGGAASGTGMRLTGGAASGDVIFLEHGLSFWGGVDPDSGTIIDTHHPACGQSVTGKVVAMPTSRQPVHPMATARHAPLAVRRAISASKTELAAA